MTVKIAGVVLSLAVAGLASTAQAQSVEIDNAVARVIYRVENRSDLEVTVAETGRADIPALQIRRVGRNIHIDGLLEGRNRINGCHSRSGASAPATPGENASVSIRGLGRIDLKDAPLLIIKGPRDVSIKTSGGVYGTVARGADNVAIATGGCGAWVVGNTSDAINVSIGGSGNVWTGSSRNMQLNIGGSGTVRSTRVNDLAVNIGGSGNVYIGEVRGDMDVRVGGSGNVEVGSGNIGQMQARVAGSGSLDINASVRDLDATIMGAGNIVVDRVTGNVSRRVVGVGNIRIRDQ